MNETGFILSFFLCLFLTFNLRYLVDLSGSIKIFTAIYDPLTNIFVQNPEENFTVSRCENNKCSFSNYEYHNNWAVTFYDRFTKFGSENNQILLKVHVLFNSLSWFLMMFQVSSYIRNKSITGHKLIGYIAILFQFIGTYSAIILSSDHDKEANYGGIYSRIGFLQMGLTCMILTAIGGYYIQTGNVEKHKIWMNRAYGAMWGSFFIFRLIEFIAGPLAAYLNSEYFKYPVLINIWFSAIIGVLIAEYYLNGNNFENKDSESSKIK